MQNNYAGFATEGIDSDIRKFLLKYRKEDFAILLPPRKCDRTATKLLKRRGKKNRTAPHLCEAAGTQAVRRRNHGHEQDECEEDGFFIYWK
jgi:hypothetical protein